MQIMGYKSDAEKLLSKCESNLNDENWIAANDAYEKLLKSDNFTTWDLNRYGYLQQLRSQQYEKKAIEYFKKAIENGKNDKDTPYYQAHSYLFDLLIKNGKIHECIEIAKNYLLEDPGNYKNYKMLANVYISGKQYDDAWLSIEAGLKIDPDNAELLNIAGDICKSLGRYDNAVDYWNKSYEINNEFCDTLYSKACMYMDLDRKEEAIKAWEVVIKWLEEHQLEYETIWPKREIEKLKIN